MDTTRKPSWLRAKLPSGPGYQAVRSLVDEHKLHTVCQSAQCPNLGECWSRGTFYQGTGSKSPSQVEAMIDAQFGFYSTRQEASSQEVGRYELRDPVKGDGCISAASTDGCASIFDFQLPAVTPDGGCGGKQLLPFLVGVPAFACDLGETGATLESVCSTTLNASFLSRILISKQPSGSAPADVRFVMTGSSVPGSLPVGSSYVPGQCTNAMVLYQLRLMVSPSGAIENVTVYVNFDTLTEANWRDATPIFGAAFEYAQAAGGTRETSGRPGYQRGLPLLVADPTGIGLRVNGLQLLPRTPLGECSTSGTHGGTQVLWREATAVTCTTRLSARDVPGWCQPTSDPNPNVVTQPLLAALNGMNVSGLSSFADAEAQAIRWGEVLPLTFLTPGVREAAKIVILSQPLRRSSASAQMVPELLRLGDAAFRVLDAMPERVALLMSSDLAHTHLASGPYGFSDAAAPFDAAVARWAGNPMANATALLDEAAQLEKQAMSCGFTSLVFLHGALAAAGNWSRWSPRLLANFAPTYYGMLVAVF